MNLLRLSGFQSIRAALQAVMHDITALLAMVMRQPEPKHLNRIPRHSHVHLKRVLVLSAPERHAESTPQPQPGISSDDPWNGPFPRP